jgi:Lipase (class 3)
VLKPVSEEVHKFLPSSNQELTGHSLGGALSAIMQATWSMVLSREFVQEGVVENRVSPHSCYTFGMPRYGDMRAVSSYRNPYHLYNDQDIVPSVPPRWLGFESCFSEFQLDGTSIENISQRESITFSSWVGRLASGAGVANHAIEIYRDRVFDELQKSAAIGLAGGAQRP